MSFPASPIDGQLATINNITYQWSATNTAWTRASIATGYLSDYVQVYNAADDAALGLNSVIIFDTLQSGSGIPYNTSTGVFTLAANKTYELYANANWAGFSDAAGGWMGYQWVDASSGTPLITSGAVVGLAEAINRNTNESISPSLKLIYTPITNQTVKLMITGASGTATARGGIGTYAIIRQIGASSMLGNITIGGGANSISTTTGAVVVNGGVGIGGNVVTGGYGSFSGQFNESTTVAGIHLGNTGLGASQTPRVVFANGTAAQNWEIDNNLGTFRWYQPGVTKMTLDVH
jgi:hypothetical protein